MTTKQEMIREIDALTKQLWDSRPHIKKEHCEYVDLGWHGGYSYTIINGNLNYPFSEPMHRLSKYGLQKILDALNEETKVKT